MLYERWYHEPKGATGRTNIVTDSGEIVVGDLRSLEVAESIIKRHNNSLNRIYPFITKLSKGDRVDLKEWTILRDPRAK